jgi:ABC-type branched-subunit amino acid transport system substrate-binding protein
VIKIIEPAPVRRITLVCTAALVLVVSACSSSDSGSGPSSTSSGASGIQSQVLDQTAVEKQITAALGALPTVTGQTTRGIDGKVITIGGEGTNTKGGQQVLQGLDVGAKARFERANRQGGVQGYTFNYAGFIDDTGQPTVAQQGVQSLVEQKKVFALVPFASASANSASYLNSNDVPYFGFLGQDYCGWSKIPYGFSVTGENSCSSTLPGGKAIGNTGVFDLYMKSTGKTASDIKLAIYSTTDPYAIAATKATEATAKALGIKVVSVETDLPGVTEPPLTDYSPVASKIVSSGANLVISETSVPVIIGVTASLKSSGFTGDFIDGYAVQALLQSPATAQIMDGSYGVAGFGNLGFGASTLQQVSDDVKAIGSATPADGIGTLIGYWAADLFIQALQKVSGPLTAQKLVNVLNQGGFEYQGIAGVTCSGPWPALRVVSAPCLGMAQYDAKSKSLKVVAPLDEVGSYVISS